VNEPNSPTSPTNQRPKKRPPKARRGRGEGGVRERKDKGQWEGTISLGYDAAGRRVRRTVYASTKNEVLDELARLRGKPLEPSEARTLTVAALMNRWLDSTKARTTERTHEERTRNVAQHLLPRLGCVVVGKLTPLAVESYYAAMRNDEVGPCAARHAAKSLTSALNFAVRLGILAGSPAKSVPLPPPGDREMTVLSPELVRLFLERTSHVPIHSLLLLALGTGLRKGELLGLHWPDVDLQAATLTVRQQLTWTRTSGSTLKKPKTKSARRTITLPRQCVEMLRGLRQQREAAGLLRATVFCTKLGKFIDWRNVTHRFNAAVEWADDPLKGRWRCLHNLPRAEPVMPAGFRFHDLRHTHASILLSQGCSIKAVSVRLGHANATITLRTYSHVLPGDDARLADTFSGVLDGPGVCGGS
jgi:integrase